MANYNLTQTGDEVQAYIDSIPVIDVTGTLSGSVVVFTTNPYPQVAANYEAGCGSIIRLTVGEDIHLIPITRFDGTAYKGSTMTGWNNVVATIEATSASAIVAISGIDDAPTAGSRNPVTSTGINTSLQNLNNSINGSLQTLQNEIDSIQPIVIEGNVTNAPDEEDITTDSNDLLKFKNRAPGLNQLGYFILRRDQTFAAQVTEANTIYEIRYESDLNGGSVTIPSGCVLKFNGGRVVNGTLDLNGAIIDGCGIMCEVSNPHGQTLTLSSCLIDDAISTPEYNRTMMQMLLNNGIGVLADVVSVTCDSRLEISGRTARVIGVLGRRTQFTFPNSDGFVFTSTQSGSHTGLSAQNQFSHINITSNGVCVNFAPDDYAAHIFASLFEDIYAISNNDSCFKATTIQTQGTTLAFDNAFRDIFVRSYNGYGFDGFTGNNPEFTRIHVWDCKLGGFHNCKGVFSNIIFDQYLSSTEGRTGWLIDYADSLGSITIRDSHLEYLKEVIKVTNSAFDIPIALVGNYISHPTNWNEDGVAKYNKFQFGGLAKGLFVERNTFLGESSLTFGSGFGEFKTINSALPKVFADRNMNIISSNAGYVYEFKAFANSLVNLIQAEYGKLAWQYIPLITSDRVHSKWNYVTPVEITVSTSTLSLTDNLFQHVSLKSPSDIATTTTFISNFTQRFLSSVRTWYLFYNANTNAKIRFNNNITNGTYLKIFTPNGQPLVLLPGEYVVGWKSGTFVQLTQKVSGIIHGGNSASYPTNLLSTDAGTTYYNSDTNSLDMWNGTEWADINGHSLKKSGTTSERPTTAINVGFSYFDTTLGKMIVWNGTAWVNMDGSALS